MAESISLATHQSHSFILNTLTPPIASIYASSRPSPGYLIRSAPTGDAALSACAYQ